MQQRLRGFFSEAVLTETRLVQAVVREPMVYPMVRMFGIRGLLDMSMIGAITLVDVVAYPEEISLDTLFHELVHVVQYRVLGLRQFAKLYVTGFLTGESYERIPLEMQAYELGARFERDSTRIFSVEQDVIRRRDSSLL